MNGLCTSTDPRAIPSSAALVSGWIQRSRKWSLVANVMITSTAKAIAPPTSSTFGLPRSSDWAVTTRLSRKAISTAVRNETLPIRIQ